MKANLFVHFPGHVIKYRGFSKRRKKTIDEYLNLQQDGKAMIAWSLNLLRRSVNLVACNMIRNTFSQNDVWCLMSKMIQISTFPAAPSTERVPSLAERVASWRYSINLRLLNNRVPALLATHAKDVCMLLSMQNILYQRLTLVWFIVNAVLITKHTTQHYSDVSAN